MWYTLAVKLFVELLKFIPGLISKIVDYFNKKAEKKKRKEAAEDAARKVENAKSPEDIRTAADNLP